MCFGIREVMVKENQSKYLEQRRLNLLEYQNGIECTYIKNNIHLKLTSSLCNFDKEACTVRGMDR